MGKKNKFSRRTALKATGAAAALGLMGSAGCGSENTISGRNATISSNEIRKTISDKVFNTPLINTHDHLPEEKDRLAGVSKKNWFIPSDDWTMVLSHYYNDDLRAAGMGRDKMRKFFSPKTDPVEKWKLLEPYWPVTKTTGYGQAVDISIRQLYGVDELSAKTVGKVQDGYEKMRRPGFYRHIIRDLGNIESCQINSLQGTPFMESAQPALLMQDISILKMFENPNFDMYAGPAGIKLNNLSDWHRAIDWWFDKYAKYAVAVKSQNAYKRDINYEDVPAEKVDAVFKKILAGKNVTGPEKKAFEDHVFWYAVNRATENDLPVKLHTGYYVGNNHMPLSRLINNPGSATMICRMSPETRFVFMHICYPYYEELISAAKQYSNAYLDMCWAWIINPVASKDFLKKYLVTAPTNKVLTFGADYIPVEPVLGHAVMARRGIAIALSELVEEGWLSLDDALELTDPIMHGNARRIFNLAEKEKILSKAPWV